MKYNYDIAIININTVKLLENCFKVLRFRYKYKDDTAKIIIAKHFNVCVYADECLFYQGFDRMAKRSKKGFDIDIKDFLNTRMHKLKLIELVNI